MMVVDPWKTSSRHASERALCSHCVVHSRSCDFTRVEIEIPERRERKKKEGDICRGMRGREGEARMIAQLGTTSWGLEALCVCFHGIWRIRRERGIFIARKWVIYVYAPGFENTARARARVYCKSEFYCPLSFPTANGNCLVEWKKNCFPSMRKCNKEYHDCLILLFNFTVGLHIAFVYNEYKQNL